MAGGIRVEAEHRGDSLTLHLTGARVSKIDAKVVQECASAIMACADTHKCLDRGLSFNENCIRTIADHDRKQKCVSQGFGFAQKSARG